MQNRTQLKDWIVIKEEKTLKTQLFDLYDQTLQGHNGEIRNYTVVKRRPTVSVIPITEKKEIYIVGQERYLLEKFCWEVMAGFVEEGEDILEAAKRELKEETGIEGKSWKKFAELEMSATAIKGTSHLFVVSDLTLGKATPDEGEYIILKKVPLKKALDMVLKGQFPSAVSTAAILLLDKMIEENKL
ncbi:NUDIX hydrolase [Candidatus Gottesmanbacteria bacterium]|nr:NUDIX hydrolase [Candidatus Gottesmanbacteria bacterium]